MSYDGLFGRDSYDHFPLRKYRDTYKDKAVVTFIAEEGGSVAGDHCCFKDGLMAQQLE